MLNTDLLENGLKESFLLAGKTALLLVFSCISSFSNAQSVKASVASINTAAKSTGLVFEASSVVLIETVKPIANGSAWLVTLSANGVSASLEIGSEVVSEGLQLSKELISVVAISTGWMLVAAGEILAFIPNTIGSELIFHFGHGMQGKSPAPQASGPGV